jgi:DNA-directed RNA polymerase subunit RPC12/RpoP
LEPNQQKIWICSVCNRKFQKKHSLECHQRDTNNNTDAIQKIFKCKQCSKRFGSKAALQQYIKDVNHRKITNNRLKDKKIRKKRQIYTCFECWKDFKS